MVSKDHDLSQRRQCTLLQLSRPTLYYRPVGESRAPRFSTVFAVERHHRLHNAGVVSVI